ncbi:MULTISPECIES: hypothetical protein [Enterobacterales]|uniref:Uncharacterized protein n=1 Tax=Escherichia coli TaxID=562 RepID=A0A1V2GBV5_ECOLX|nr:MULTISPECIES: hypothetical protein [Enterobacterales]EHT9936679.1 hypothetical protein [Serratia marcescens]MBZ2001703.1 hypothetical protein [Klebsiella pneumoniae]MDD1876259.1 hypothetical protein [Klebsiella pneumoniae]MEC4505574.1 hypothetical protein [Klebsiella pneumoniae]ONG19159.1 hypothetical protein BWR13_01370 [Escherichia coli]
MSNKIYINLKKVFNNEVSVDGFFERGFSDLDYKHIAALSALIFVEDKINTNKLSTYSNIIVRLNLDDFAFALVCLYEMYEDNDILLPCQEKKKLILAILYSLTENGNSSFYEYKRRATHVISGAYQLDQYWGEDPPLYGWGHKDSILVI